MRSRPRLALVSTDVRRDVHAPLRFFERVEPVHLYRWASYRDFTPDAGLVRYRSPAELVVRLAQLRPDVVQSVEAISLRLVPVSYTILAYCRLTRTPLIVGTFENRPWQERFGRLAPLAQWAARPLFAAARVVVVVNEGGWRNALVVGADPTRVRRVMWGSWGVDLEEFQPGTPVAEPRLLFAGRLHPEKGIFDLLAAFAQLRETLPAAQLLLAGDGPARREVQQRAGPGVVLLGVVPHAGMPALIRSVAVVVSPSRTTPKWEEQVGMTNLQALACGVPVVASWSGAIPEYTPPGAGALLVPEGDPPALAAALRRLLTDPALRGELGRLGRRFAERHYDARRNVQRAERLVLAVLDR
jgi:glycosyltransferase involved in cell wall biosynthesis